MIKVYQKQPIQAEQFDGRQKHIFGHKVISDNSLVDALTHDPVYYSILIDEDDPEEEPDEVIFGIGYWITKHGEDIHAIADDVFKNTYAELPVIPEAVADTIERKREINGYGLGYVLFEATEFEQPEGCAKWIATHQELVARAWLDGYQVEAQHDTQSD